MKLLVRYFAYLAFAAAALVFWFVVIGSITLGDHACNPYPCAPAPLWLKLISMSVVWGAIPITALAFMLYRRIIRVLLGMDEVG